MNGCHFFIIFVFLLVSNHAKEKKKPGSHSQHHHTTEPPKSSVAILNQLLTNYIEDEPPRLDEPTQVQLGIYVNTFYSVSEQTMDYSVNMYVRQSWYDPRLAYNGTFPNNKDFLRLFSDPGSLGGGMEGLGIWLPDTFFRNEKKAKFHSVTVNNKLVNLYNDSKVWYVTKVSATLSCPMRLHRYPFDTQVCGIKFESFSYRMDVMYFSWLNNPIQIDKDVLLPQFTLVTQLLYDCSLNYTGGAFPCQEIRFVLKRDMGFFIIQVFIPSILVVILSWVSFWINIDAVPARVSLGLLTVLTTTTQSSGINAQLPKVSYIKAIDIWMITCLLFVFAALIEYAFVNVAARNGARIRTPIVRQPAIHCASDGNLRSVTVQNTRKPPAMLTSCWKSLCQKENLKYVVSVDMEGSKRKARQMDNISRKIFPLAFIFFNALYWGSCLIPANIDLRID